MGKINILQPGVFNMISAGEVVERPASVVKELVENSIDAGATEISVTVEEGGIRRIVVSDNGTGILKEDMRAAFLPHATSKLAEISDLDTISTLGFRGEALASIASVSEVTMVSRADGAECAERLVLKGGKVVDECADSRAKGTSVTVENLFFNTPARLKFLKKPSVEQGHVADAVEKIILAEPSLKISLHSEKGTLIEHNGGDLKDALGAVYPDLDLARFLEVDRVSSSGVRVKGYISEVDYTAPTRSRQTVIVNGRTVVNDTVTAAVDKAYREYLVKRTFPMYVLDIVVPFEEVDVNVHPAKTEVRFRNKNERERYEQTSMDTAELYSWQGSPSPYGDVSPTGPAEEELPHPVYDGRGYAPDISSLRKAGGVSVRPQYRGRSVADSGISPYAMPYSDTDEAFLRISSEPDDTDLANSLNNKFRLFDGTVVGQVFDTYLIVERANVVYVIDQHAAHERILYEKLSASLSSEYSQLLLIPHKLRLSGEEGEYFEKIMPSLNAMGFSIEKNPGNFMVYAVPAPVVRMDFNRFLAELFSHMLDDGEVKMTDLLKDVICRDACRAAIKGGEHLTKRQIEYAAAKMSSRAPCGGRSH